MAGTMPSDRTPTARQAKPLGWVVACLAILAGAMFGLAIPQATASPLLVKVEILAIPADSLVHDVRYRGRGGFYRSPAYTPRGRVYRRAPPVPYARAAPRTKPSILGPRARPKVYATPAKSGSTGAAPKPLTQAEKASIRTKLDRLPKQSSETANSASKDKTPSTQASSSGTRGPAGQPRLTQQFKHASSVKFDPHARAAIARAKESKGNVVVLGKWPMYSAVSGMANARKFEIPPKKWASMSTEQRNAALWPANRKFLDRAIRSGKRIVLASDPRTATGGYKREIDYLKSKGYKVSEDGLEMISEQ